MQTQLEEMKAELALERSLRAAREAEIKYAVREGQLNLVVQNQGEFTLQSCLQAENKVLQAEMEATRAKEASRDAEVRHCLDLVAVRYSAVFLSR
jgi:hypothetical protein